MVILKEAAHRDDALGMDHDLKLIGEGDLHLLDVLGQALGHVAAKLLQLVLLQLIAGPYCGCFGVIIITIIITLFRHTPSITL